MCTRLYVRVMIQVFLSHFSCLFSFSSLPPPSLSPQPFKVPSHDPVLAFVNSKSGDNKVWFFFLCFIISFPIPSINIGREVSEKTQVLVESSPSV